MNCKQIEENISAYLDKALSDEEMLLVKTHLETCPACQKEYNALEKTVLMLKEMDEIAPPASFRRELRRKLENSTKKKEVSLYRFIPNPLKNTWRSYLMPVAVVLVIMLVLIPFVGKNLKMGSGSKASSQIAMDSAAGERNLEESLEKQAPLAAPKGAGEVKFFATDSSSPAIGESLRSSAETIAPTSAEIERKIIKNADVTLQVDDYNTTVEAIKNKVMSVNGYISNESLNGAGDNGVLSGYMQVRVPAVHFEEFISGMDALGKVKGRSIYSQDVTEEYVDVDSRLKAMKTKEERLLAILSKSGNLSDILAVEKELANTRAQLESLQGRLRYLDNRTELSSVSINIKQVAASTQQVSTGGLKDVLSKTKEAFILAINSILLGAGKLVIFIGAAVPYLVLIGLVALCVRWYWNKKKKVQE